MPTPTEFKAPFLYNSYYHVVFKSIDGLLLFNSPSDYSLFLDRFKVFTNGLLDIWVYILLQNHVHFIIKIKSSSEIKDYISGLSVEHQTVAMKKLLAKSKDEKLLDLVIERQVNSFMVSYVNTVNNKNNKQGGFFQKPFRRVLIVDDAHLQQAIIYVHANAQKHQLTDDFTKYRLSSYHEIITGLSVLVNSKAVLTFFNGIEKFIETHRLQVAYFYSNNWPSSKIEV